MNKLTDLDIQEVSFCGKGVNKSAKIVLFKAKKEVDKALTFEEAMAVGDEQEQVQEEMDELMKGVWAYQDTVHSIVADEEVENKDELLRAAGESFAEFINANVRKGDESMNELLKDLSPEVQKLFADQEQALTDANKANEELSGKIEELTKKVEELTPAENDDDAVAKAKKEGASAEVITLLEKAQKDNEKNAAKIVELEKAQRKQAMVEKCKDLKHVGKSDEIADMLEAIADSNAELSDEVYEVLTKAEKAIEESELFKENGRTGGDDEASGESRVQELAEEKVQKAEAAGQSLSIEQARVQVRREIRKAAAKGGK